MAPLTWKNVEAPGFSGAANLSNATNSAFQSALDSLKGIGKDINTRDMNNYSKDALLKAASIQDREQFDAFLGGLDTSRLTPGTAEAFTNYPEHLIRLQQSEENLNQLYAKNDYEQQGWADKEATLAEQREVAVGMQEVGRLAAENRVDEANALQAQLMSKYPKAALEFANTSGGNSGYNDNIDTASNRLKLDVANDEWNQTLSDRQRLREVNTETYKLIQQHQTRNGAKQAVINGDYSPEVKNMLLANIDGEMGANIELIDEDLRDVYPDDDVRAAVGALQSSAAGELAVLQNELDQDGTAEVDRILGKINEGNVTDWQEFAKSEGIQADGFFAERMTDSIANIRDRAKDIGVNITEAQAAAILIAGEKTGNVPFINRDSAYADVSDADIVKAAELYSPEMIGDRARRNARTQMTMDNIVAQQERVAGALDMYRRAKTDNDAEAMEKYGDAVDKAIQGLDDLTNNKVIEQQEAREGFSELILGSLNRPKGLTKEDEAVRDRVLSIRREQPEAAQMLIDNYLALEKLKDEQAAAEAAGMTLAEQKRQRVADEVNRGANREASRVERPRPADAWTREDYLRQAEENRKKAWWRFGGGN